MSKSHSNRSKVTIFRFLFLALLLLAALPVKPDSLQAQPLSATPEHPAPAAIVITQNKVEKSRAKSYSAKFLTADAQSLARSIALGASRSKPVAFQGAFAKRFWIAIRKPKSAEWELVGYANPSGREVRRLPLGKLPLLTYQTSGFWAAESDDGKWLHFLERKQRRWLFNTYGIESGELHSSIQLRGADFRMTRLSGGRWLADQSATTKTRKEGLSTMVILDGESGEILFRQKFSPTRNNFARLSPDRNHLFLFRHKSIGGTVSAPGSLGSADHLTELRVIDVTTGSVITKKDLGYNLLTPLSAHDANGIYALTQYAPGKTGFTLWRLEGGEAVSMRQSNAYCAPKAFSISTTNELLTVFCDPVVLHGSLSGNSAFQRGSINLRPGRALYSDQGDAVFLLNKKGSHIGKIDLRTLEHIATRATTSGTMKLVRAAIGVVRMAGAVAGYIDVQETEHTTLALHPDNSERLYALNQNSTDLHVFDGPAFESVMRRSFVRKPISFLRFPTRDIPWVFYLGERQVLAFSADSAKPKLNLEQGSFLGLDTKKDQLYFNRDSALQIYSLIDLSLIAEHSGSENAIQLLPTNQAR